MFSALLYLQVQSFKNRLWERLRRLRRPRYLFGALAGGLYFLMIFSRSFFGVTHVGVTGRAGPVLIPGVTPDIWEFLAALVLLILCLLAWLIPHERAALVFTEAEIAFLFPAPIRRSTLIHYKLVRSQTAVLFTVFFLTLFTRWSGGIGGALIRAAGWWILISTINMHLLGSSFARTILLERGITPWRRRAAILGLLALVLGGAVLWAGHSVPPLTDADTLSLTAFFKYVGIVAHSAPAFWLLLPFRVVVRPFLTSSDARAFARAIGPALGLLAVHYLWVIRSNVNFEEASIEASRRHAVRITAMREGRGLNTRPARRRRAPFRLSPTGFPAVAILWKNLLGAGQLFNVRIALVILVWSVAGSGAITASGAAHTAWPTVIGWICAMIGGWSLLLGPQFVRADFRRDLAAADLLKIYPLKGWELALGELLAPALILTVLQWGLLLFATILLSGSIGEAGPHRHPFPAGAALSIAVLVPGFNLVSLIVPNAAALLLPAWFAGSAGTAASSRGVEVIGQRLIFLLAQLLAIVIALLPAVIASFLTYTLATSPFMDNAYALTISATVAALVFFGEAAIGVYVLGHWFEQFDVSAERIA